MFTSKVLSIDPAAEVERIAHVIREQVMGTLRRRGAVLGVSGGVDSSVVAALCTRALGRDRVLAILMPERDSEDDSTRLGELLISTIDVPSVLEPLAPALEGISAYARQVEAIREVFPEYGDGWRCKIGLPSLMEGERLNVFFLTVASPDGTQRTARMPPAAFQKLVAATSFKQRLRKSVEYYHADRLHYAVAGTPNLLEYDQGFFVKQGDGAADIKPIAHLYKTQVYALAEYLGIPEEIRSRPPTTDTYSLPQSQEEFYFALPWDQMDLSLWAYNHKVPAADAATVLGLQPEQVERVYRDIEAKRRAAIYLQLPPMLAGPAAV